MLYICQRFTSKRLFLIYIFVDENVEKIGGFFSSFDIAYLSLNLNTAKSRRIVERDKKRKNERETWRIEQNPREN